VEKMDAFDEYGRVAVDDRDDAPKVTAAAPAAAV